MAKTSAKKKPAFRGQVAKAMLAGAILGEAINEGRPITKTEILRKAGYSESVVDRGGGSGGTMPWTSEAFKASLEASGWGVDKLQKVLNEAAEANVVAVYQGKAKETDAPDHATRMRAVKQIAEYTGLAVKRTESKTLNVHASADEAAKLLGI